MRRYVLVLAVALAACGASPRSTPTDWSAEVLARHADVDRMLERGDGKAARSSLLALERHLERAQRGSVGKLAAARKDTSFRLARLALDAKDLPAALRDCDAGLAVGGGDDIFTANLLALRGTIRQEMGQNAPAAEDFHRALLINEALLGQALTP